jgi:Na+-translocating ferredoxin:NAD+ oxidoreductase RnfG subunit
MSFQTPKRLLKKVNKQISTTFDVETFDLKPRVFNSSNTQDLLAKFSEDNFYSITSSNNNLLGYAYIGKAPSKTDEFDYLILFDANLIIKKSKILVYREDYGGEIGSKRWLKQFIGKSQNDKMAYGNDIVAISGATISAQSMTQAVNNVLNSLAELQKQGVFDEN